MDARASHVHHNSNADGRGSHNARASQRPPPQASQHGIATEEKKPKLLKSSKRSRRGSQSKVRVHLPPIESYEKELDFAADGPGRVVVRLERLMGSDRVRLTDTKYMSTLLERLEEQERKAWARRRFGRIKIERNRFRKLAIDGLMEPGPDMQDLYQHPVFRVNRILNRLAKMDTNITLTPTDKLPPIIEVDPFLDDDCGRVFKTYPGHNIYSGWEDTSKRSSHVGFNADDDEAGGSPRENMSSRGSTRMHKARLSSRGSSRGSAIPSARPSSRGSAITKARFSSRGSSRGSAIPTARPSKIGSTKSTVRMAEPEVAPTSMKKKKKYRSTIHRPNTKEKVNEENASQTNFMISRPSSRNERSKIPQRMSLTEFPELSEMEQQYGIPPETDLMDWEPFRSHLVDTVFHEDGQRVWDLYTMAEDVLGVYSREVEVGDDFSTQLGRLMRG